VLHQQHGHVPLALHAAQDFGQRRRLVDVEARRRLVRQEQARLAGQGPAELDEAAVPEAQGGHGHLRQVLEADELEHGVDGLHLVGLHATFVEQVLPQRAVAAPGPLGHDHVVAHGQVGEDLDALERPADPEPGAQVGGQLVDGLPAEVHAAGARAQLAAHAVEQRRLAGAVRAHEPDRLPRRHRQRHVVEGLHAAELDRDRPRFEQPRAARGPQRRGARPGGRLRHRPRPRSAG